MFVVQSNVPGFLPESVFEDGGDLAASDFEDAVDLLVDEMNRHVDDLAEAFGADARIVKDAELLILEAVAEAKAEPGEIVVSLPASDSRHDLGRNFSILVEDWA